MHENFERFTERAREVMTLAKEEAQRFNHNYIGTEHLLLGLVREGEGVAAQVLSNLGVELTKVRSAVEFIIGRGERQVFGEIGLTPRAKKIVNVERVRTETLKVLVGSAPAQPEPAEPGHEATASSGESGTLHKVRWEYLLVQTTRSDDGTVRVHSVNGQDDPRFAANETPIYEALRVLGEDGWELMGIDSPGEPEAAGLYVFKRPER
jgi:hypothetical protein